ncbi:MAG: hypothetical protein KJO98_04505 [Rhodothermia bacterium]|nr:hypothetical protein [Rhodothermia bacterium]
MKYIGLIIFVMPLAVACSDNDGRSEWISHPPSAAGELLFRSGFEGSVAVSSDLSRLVGYDSTTGHSWEKLPEWVDEAKFTYVVADSSDLDVHVGTRLVRMMGPDGNENTVLELTNRQNDPNTRATSRNELSFFSKSNEQGFGEGFVRYYTRLQDDLFEQLPDSLEAGLFYLMEWKDQPIIEASQAAGWSSFRVNVGISRDSDNDQFYWVATGREAQPDLRTEWQARNGRVPVVAGEWFLVEAYLRKDPELGRVFFAIDGEEVFDLSVRTSHSENPQRLRFWSMFKLYHNDKWLTRGPTRQWFDDLEIWSGFPPGYPFRKDVRP